MGGRGLFHDDLAPADMGEVVMEADWSKARDSFGKTLFSAYWWPGRFGNLGEPSAQGFYGNPEQHADLWEQSGRTVRVVNA